MTDDLNVLARRAVACKGWKWMPGMADQFGRRVMQVYPEGLGIKWSHLLENKVVRDADALPDLTDPATRGCLLALVREVWGDPFAFIGWFDPHWKVIVSSDSLIGCLGGRGASEAEALVVAWEAAHDG